MPNGNKTMNRISLSWSKGNIDRKQCTLGKDTIAKIIANTIHLYTKVKYCHFKLAPCISKGAYGNVTHANRTLAPWFNIVKFICRNQLVFNCIVPPYLCFSAFFFYIWFPPILKYTWVQTNIFAKGFFQISFPRTNSFPINYLSPMRSVFVPFYFASSVAEKSAIEYSVTNEFRSLTNPS